MFRFACNLLIALWCLGSAFAPAIGMVADSPSKSSIDDDRWLLGEVDFANELDISTITSGCTGDFDHDGFEDVAVLTNTSFLIAWNGPLGLGKLNRMNSSDGGTLVLWDAESHVLWTQQLGPNHVVAWQFKGRSLAPLVKFPGKPRSMRLVLGEGVLTLGRQGKELELLDAGGHSSVLIASADALIDAAAASTSEANGLLILQEDNSGRLGLSRNVNGSWTEVRWWEDTGATRQWHLLKDAMGRTIITGIDATDFWMKALDAQREVTSSWRYDCKGLETEYWPVQITPDGALHFVTRALVSFGVSYQSFDIASGKQLGWYRLNELDKIPLLLTPDLNGDGSKDILHTHEASVKWNYYIHWGSGIHRLLWSRPSPDDLGIQLDLPRVWNRALDGLKSIEEIWIYHAQLLVKCDGKWVTLEATDHHQRTASPLLERAGSSYQLDVSFIDVGETEGQRRSIAEIDPDRWYHLVYQRGANEHTQIWLDGACVFDGSSKDYRYYYNMLILGAGFGRKYQSHSAVAVDRVAVFGKPLTDEEIAAEIALQTPVSNRYLIERWDFDADEIVGSWQRQPVDIISKPKRIPGIDGSCLTFDGRDDAVRIFTPIDPDSFALSMFFRIKDDQRSAQTLAMLYGMYNTAVQILYQPRNLVLEPTQPGAPIVSPPKFNVTELSLPGSCSPFVLNNALYMLDAEGMVYQDGPLGWEPFQVNDIVIKERVGMPWVSNGQMHTLDACGAKHSWSPVNGWNHPITSRATGNFHSLGSQGGVFMRQDDASWTWIEDDQPFSWWSTDTVNELHSIQWNPGGERVQLGKLPAQAWHPEKRNFPLKQRAAFFHSDPVWLRPLLFWGWISTGVLFLLIALFFKRIRMWFDISEDDPTQPHSELPDSIRRALEFLVLQHEGQFDTHILDELLSPSSFETDETRRTRRSRFIKEVNDWCASNLSLEGLVRKKDPLDRRRTLYALNQELIAQVRSQVGARRNGA